MFKWLKRVVKAIGHVFSPAHLGEHLDQLEAAVEVGRKAIKPILKPAVEVLTVIAQMTPNRTLAEITALAAHYGLPFIYGEVVDREAVLHDIAFKVLKRMLPNTPDRWLHRAIEDAFGALKP